MSQIEPQPLPDQSRFAFIVGRFNEEITNGLLAGGKETLAAAGVSDDRIDVYYVPGAYEIPLIAAELAELSDGALQASDVDEGNDSPGGYDAIVALGCVIKGQTSHDEHINRYVSMTLGELSVEYGIPITFGILTVNSRQQAIDRSGGSVANRGSEAAAAAVEMCQLLAAIRGQENGLQNF